MGGDLMAQQWDVPGFTEVRVLGSGGFGEVVLARATAAPILAHTLPWLPLRTRFCPCRALLEAGARRVKEVDGG